MHLEPTPTLTLPRDVAHLWCLDPEAQSDPAQLARLVPLMTPDEAAAQQRFVFPEGRKEYLLTRALVRTVLSRYAPVAPGDWTFVRNAYGRPAVSGPVETDLRFNLSNTRGLIVCLVARGRDVGVDVEDVSRPTETVEIADRYFAPAEVRALRALPADQRQGRFFDYWTLKESYIKARGLGLAIPLDQFAFQVDGGPKISIAFDPRLGDSEAEWQFARVRPTDRHLVAVALRQGDDPPLRVELKTAVL